MKIRSWWFRGICVALVGTIIGTTFGILSLNVSVKVSNKQVSLAVNSGNPAKADSPIGEVINKRDRKSVV